MTKPSNSNPVCLKTKDSRDPYATPRLSHLGQVCDTTESGSMNQMENSGMDGMQGSAYNMN